MQHAVPFDLWLAWMVTSFKELPSGRIVRAHYPDGGVAQELVQH